jgi:hypothetical protein
MKKQIFSLILLINSINPIFSENNTIQYYYDLGKKYAEDNQPEKSVECFKQVLELDPEHINAQLQLGLQYMKLYRYEEAAEHLDTTLKKFPSSVTTLKSKALCAKYLGQTSQAIMYFKEVQKIAPDDKLCTLRLSELYRATGQFKDGWQLYLNRFNKNSRHFNQKKIDLASIAGKTILIHREGEIGDNIMFIRYAKILKKHGAHVIAQVHPTLVPLFSLCTYFDEITAEEDKLFEKRTGDMMIWQQSLPVAFDTRLETIPADIPYVSADQALIDHWTKIMATDKNFKIAICWQANPALHLENNPLSKRSIPLKMFQEIMCMPGVSIYSLQKQHGLEQIALLSADSHLRVFKDFDTNNGPFMDTAALLPNFDLVLTIDTSIAHLAGALGVQTWILLPFIAEWRWMENRNDSPWYPTMQLFRQTEPYNWQPIFENISREIALLAQNKLAKG